MATANVLGGGRFPRKRSRQPEEAGAHPGAPVIAHADNALVDGLPRLVQERLRPLFERVALRSRTVIVRPNETFTHVWFPTTAVLSVITIMPDGRAVEVGAAGPEGMVGIPVVLGVGAMPRQALVQIPGEALRMAVEPFRAALDAHPELRALLLRYAHAYLDDMAQSVACNRLHSVEQRCARWILKTHDRVRGDFLPLTQEFLAFMLGVRRAGVSVAAESLQRAGVIRYQRGKVAVLDRSGLERASCACYAMNLASFRRAMGDGESELAAG